MEAGAEAVPGARSGGMSNSCYRRSRAGSGSGSMTDSRRRRRGVPRSCMYDIGATCAAGQAHGFVP